MVITSYFQAKINSNIFIYNFGQIDILRKIQSDRFVQNCSKKTPGRFGYCMVQVSQIYFDLIESLNKSQCETIIKLLGKLSDGNPELEIDGI